MPINVGYSPYRSSFSSLKSPRSKSAGLFSRVLSVFGQGLGRRRRMSAGRKSFSGALTQSNVRDMVSGRLQIGNEKGKSFSEIFQKVKGSILKFEFGPFAMIFSLSALVVVFGFLYLVTFNQLATKGYDLKRLDAAHQQLMNQYDIKNMKTAQIKSLNTIARTDRVSVMVKPSKVEYVTTNTALASL